MEMEVVEPENEVMMVLYPMKKVISIKNTKRKSTNLDDFKE